MQMAIPCGRNIMETAEMGRVTVEAMIENMTDLWAAKKGQIPASDIRYVTVPDALIDTGAVRLSLPTSLIRQLGIDQVTTRRMNTSAGPRDANVYDVVRLTIQDRFCAVEVLEVPDGVPTLIGQIPLESLDFVVDPLRRRLIGNPAHGGEHVYEQY
jgi:predicted aspartyl protease